MTGTPRRLTETPDGGALIDEALRMIRLSSAVFLRGEFTAPWALLSLGPEEYAAALCPGAERLILFHVVLEGRCTVRMETGEEASLGPGEAVVVPYCDQHRMGHPRLSQPVPFGRLVPPLPWRTPPVVRHGNGGEATRILCGYLNCQDLLFHPVLKALPKLVHVRPATRSAAAWLSATAHYALEKTSSWNPSAAGAQLPEFLLVECLRQYVAALPPERTGWLAALRDPVVGCALVLLHGAPAESWTVARLAREVGTSRSVLGDRFAAMLGEPPMRYLAQWRLQVASHLLGTTAETIPEIAARVGYESDAAFSRAFKRGLGAPPASWRTKARATPIRRTA
jgi:AraC-like DNA-binding protein